MSNINTIEHHNEVICKAAREALIGTGLELLAHPLGYEPPCYVSFNVDTDDYVIRIGVGSEPPDLCVGYRVVARQLISCCAAYAGDAQLLAEVNRACMDARKEIHAQLTAIAAKVDPRRNCGRESGK